MRPARSSCTSTLRSSLGRRARRVAAQQRGGRRVSVEVVVRPTGGGFDWALFAAVLGALGSIGSAVFTFRLWKTAKGELLQLLEAAAQADRGRTMQLEAAEAARMDALRPVVTVERGTVKTSDFLSVAEVDLRNIGVGPALGVTLQIWFQEGRNVGTALTAEPMWSGDFGPVPSGDRATHGGARWSEAVDVGRLWEPGWLVCRVEYEDVYSRAHEDWWSAWVDFQQTPSWRHGWAD